MSRKHSVSDFLSKFQHGFAKPNRFRVEFNLPRGIQKLQEGEIGVNEFARESNIGLYNSLLNFGGSIDIKCHTATMPQRSLMTFEHKQNSAPVRYPYSSTYDPVTFSFYADNRYHSRAFFEIWQSAAINFKTNTVNFRDEYVSDIRMYAMDERGRDTYGVILYDAYPLNVGIVDFSYSQQNNFQTTTVTMSFRMWEPLVFNTNTDDTGG